LPHFFHFSEKWMFFSLQEKISKRAKVAHLTRSSYYVIPRKFQKCIQNTQQRTQNVMIQITYSPKTFSKNSIFFYSKKRPHGNYISQCYFFNKQPATQKPLAGVFAFVVTSNAYLKYGFWACRDLKRFFINWYII
jgi:hypothetical protein